MNQERWTTAAHKAALKHKEVLEGALADGRITPAELRAIRTSLQHLTVRTGATDVADQIARGCGRVMSADQMRRMVNAYIAVADEVTAA